MPYQTNPELAAVNYVLRKLGEQPVTGLDVPYPTVSVAMAALETSRRALLTDEWYFNTFNDAVLEYDSITDCVPVPFGVLQAYPHDPKYVSTGKTIVYAADGTKVDHGVPCKIVRDITLSDLPIQALYVVQASAALETYTQDFGADNTAAVLQEEYLGAYHQLGSQHTRTRRSRVQDRTAWQRHMRKLRN